MQISEVHDIFQLQARANGRSVNTQTQYARHIRMLEKWLAASGRSTDIKDTDHVAVAEFLCSTAVREKHGGGARKATSANGIRSSLRSFLGWAHAAGYAPRNAAALVQRARCSPRLGRVLSEEEVRRLDHVLATQASDRDRIMFRLALGCGLRVGSLVALQAEDIGGGEVLVRRAKNDVPVRLFVPRALRPELEGYAAGRTGPLFAGAGGGPLTTRHVGRLLVRWCERARVAPCSPHALRRTCGTRLYAACRDPLLVQRGLGHKSLVSCLPYIGGVEERLRAVMGA